MADLASRRTALARIAAAGAATVPATALADDHPDAELLRLGQELEATWAEERATYAGVKGSYSDEADEITDAAAEATGEIVRQIEQLRATTLEGLRVKALALSWCYNGEHDEIDFASDQNTTDNRLVTAIVGDLLAMRETVHA